MLNLQLARKYSRAIFEIAQDEQKLEEYGKELAAVSQVVYTQPELEGFVTNPQVQPAAKKELLGKIFEGELSPNVANFIMLLVDKRRISLLSAIESEYQQLSNQARGIVIADVTTAQKIGAGQMEKLRAKLAKTTRREVKIRPHTDASIIGGVVVQIGDKRIDGSVAGRIQALRAELMANQ